MAATNPQGDGRLLYDEFLIVWKDLRNRVIVHLEGFGKEIDAFGKKDFWVVDDDLGIALVQVEINDLELLRPAVIYGLRDLLLGYPQFAITVAVVAPDGADWPRMGISLAKGEIIDGLKRAYLPDGYREIHYEGSRPD